MNPPLLASTLIPFQPELLPILPTIEGNVDYKNFRCQLERIDEILVKGKIEHQFVEKSLHRWTKGGGKPHSIKQIRSFQLHSMRALRCNIARTLLGLDFRDMSCRIADGA